MYQLIFKDINIFSASQAEGRGFKSRFPLPENQQVTLNCWFLFWFRFNIWFNIWPGLTSIVNNSTSTGSLFKTILNCIMTGYKWQLRDFPVMIE